jgi:hypothetical protein
MRASDEDRQRVVSALERHAGAGRLTLDEFADRVEVAAGARTLDELAAITHDLPTDHPEPRRELLWVFAIAILTLILLGIGLALR